jgi:predicted glycoside hydrolase/deacetylase ChbG (UPF0249 family)
MTAGSSLIVNADDFGRTPGVTQGILRAHREGVVTSTTAMVNLPHAEGALRRAWAEAPELGTGIHLNLTAGRPVLPASDVPSLVEDGGQFYPIRSFVARRERIDVGQVRAELRAQIERFRGWGREPTHLDAHHHSLYLAPRLFRVLVDLAAGYGLPIRYPWPREPLTRERLAALADAHRVGAEELPAIIAGSHAVLERSGVAVPRRCLLTFYGAQATRAHLLELIASLPAGVSELMCHPGVADAALQASSGYAGQREEELAVLTDPGVQEALRTAGVQLVSFRSLPSFGPVS